jgi:hypothetical protein
VLEQSLRITLLDIAPYLVSARRIPFCGSFILFTAYSWLNTLIPALSGIGVGIPILTRVVQSKETNVTESLAASGPLGYLILILCAAWVVLKFLAEREDGLKRGTLMRVCHREMVPEQALVTRALRNLEPQLALEEIFKKLSTIYDRHNQQESWPWPGKFAPNYSVDAEKLVDEWIQNWRNRNLAPAVGAPLVQPRASVSISSEELRTES